jgi:4'-phosphopantetheinyl transferase
MTVASPINAIAALEPGEIHLWLSFYDQLTDPQMDIACRELLNREERAQEARFYFPHDRRQYLFSRALLRRTLSRYVPVDPADWVFSSNAYGRPQIVNAEAARLDLSFNVSHTRGLIVLAVTRQRILGVDVENIACRRASIDLADRYFATDEVAALKAVPRHLQSYRFFEYWTFKEAYIKARGMGLSLPLDKFSFHYPNEHRVALVIQPELQDDAARWQFWQFQPTAEHLVAVCAEVTAASSPVICASEPGSANVIPTFLRRSRWDIGLEHGDRARRRADRAHR